PPPQSAVTTHTSTTCPSTLSLHDALPISFGSATSLVATLTVVDFPVISLQPQSTNVTLGANVSLSVTASGVGLQYQWRKNGANIDRKSTRLNSSHGSISYAVFCLKKKKTT